jgi:hypothetical protein
MLRPRPACLPESPFFDVPEFVQRLARLNDPAMAILSFRCTFSTTFMFTCPHPYHVLLSRPSDLFPFLPGRLDPYHLHGAHHLCHLGCSVAGFAVDPSPGQQSRLAPVDT